VEAEFDTSAYQNFKSTLNRRQSELLRYFGNIIFKYFVCKVGSPPENGEDVVNSYTTVRCYRYRVSTLIC
jgi:hypothetical protein